MEQTKKEQTAKSEKIEEKKEVKEIDIKNIGSIRWGNYRLFGVTEQIPRQGITTTNINHLTKINREDINFDSDLLGVLAFYEHFNNYGGLLRDYSFFQQEVNNLNEHINGHGTKNILFLPEINKNTRFTDEHNEKIIDLQLKAESPIITCFVTNDVNLDELKEKLKEIKDKKIVFFLDMNLPFLKFKKAYLLGIKYKPLIGFIYRGENKENKFNYDYIADRPENQIVRILVNLTSKTKAKIEVCRSFDRWRYGFDYFLFATRIGKFQEGTRIRAFDRDLLQFVDIDLLDNCNCIIDDGNKPIDTAKKYTKDKAYIPSSIHDIFKINEVFEGYIERLDKKEDITEELIKKVEVINTEGIKSFI